MLSSLHGVLTADGPAIVGHHVRAGAYAGGVALVVSGLRRFVPSDCPGHAAWLGPANPTMPEAPLHLVADQPTTRLHSQLDFGRHSRAAKHRGREVARMHPADAAARGVADGDVIRLFNARGACLAAVRLTKEVRPGVVQLPTGAWHDPENPEQEGSLCVHENPNVLTEDVDTSNLAQGCSGQLTVVQVERFTGNLPPIRCGKAHGRNLHRHRGSIGNTLVEQDACIKTPAPIRGPWGANTQGAPK